MECSQKDVMKANVNVSFRNIVNTSATGSSQEAVKERGNVFDLDLEK